MKMRILLLSSLCTAAPVIANPEYADADLAQCAAYYVEEERCGADAFDLHDVPMQALIKRQSEERAMALLKQQQQTLRGYSALELNGLYRYCLSMVLNTASDVQLQTIIANGNERHKPLQDGSLMCKGSTE